MKKRILKQLFKIAKEEYNRTYKFDNKLQELLGGDTTISRETPVVDAIVELVASEYPGYEDDIYWFFYEFLISVVDEETEEKAFKELFKTISKKGKK